MLSDQYKTCFKCQQPKLLSEFYKHSRMKDGRLNATRSKSAWKPHGSRSRTAMGTWCLAGHL